MKEVKEVKEEIQEPQIEVRNAQEIKDSFLSVEVKGLYSKEFCQCIFNPKTEQNEKLLEALKSVDVKPYVVDIEALKIAKHAELKSIMQAKRKNLTCEYADDVFDCNEQAQSNMTSLMSFENLGLTEFLIRSANEHTHTFNSAQLVELATLMFKALTDLYIEYWSYKNALYECKTKEEIEKINW